MNDKIDRTIFDLMDRDAISEHFPDILEALSNPDDGRYIYLSNIPEDISYWAPDAVEYFGLPDTMMRGAGKIWMHHVAPQDRDAYTRDIEAVFSGEKHLHDMIYRAMNKDGHYVTCSCRGKAVCDADGKPKFFAGTIINHETGKSVDPVTGLYNRTNLMIAMQNLMDSHTPYYIFMIGLRNFFDVNSAYGYKFGNKVLKSIAEYAVAYRNEGMLYRTEGTKFVYVIPVGERSIDDLQKEFESMQVHLENNLIVDGNHLTVDICGAMMTVSDFDVDVNSIYNSALYVMQKAKRENAQNLVVVDEDYFEGKEKHLKLLSEIRNCISEGFRGFELFYQPIMDSFSEEIKGMEALIRWRDADGNLIPPGEFIPWLEQDPIYYELGAWIIERAIRDTKKILVIQPGFTININLAYPQLQRTEFNDLVKDILSREDFPAENIRFELTERCKLLDQEALRNAMVQFKTLGMQTALDDFGTGYSALNLMTDLPVDMVKIDKSFVDDIETDIPKQILLRAISSCARELGKKVCVEGIETEEIARFLRSHFPVTHYQGFYFSKPLPYDDFMDYYYNHNRRLEAEQEHDRVMSIMR